MPKLGELIEVWDGGNVEPMLKKPFICVMPQGVIVADSEEQIQNLRDGYKFSSYTFENWREIPKPKRVHWEREDYPKIPRLYQKKESDHWLSITTITESGIYISGSIFVTFDKFAECFDLLNEDGSLTELYKEVSE